MGSCAMGGVQWGGVQWGGVQWGGVQWGGAQWGDEQCSRTILVHQVARFLATVAGSSLPSFTSFTVNFHPRNR